MDKYAADGDPEPSPSHRRRQANQANWPDRNDRIDPGFGAATGGGPAPAQPAPAQPVPGQPVPGQPVPGDPTWGPARWISSVTLLAMLGALVWRLVDHDPENRVVAAVLVAIFAVVTLLLVRIRVRLRVVPGGIAVTGPLHTRRIDWAQIATISSSRRAGRGGRGRGRGATLLELEILPPDTGSTPGSADIPDTGGTLGAASFSGGSCGGAGNDEPSDTELLAFGRFDLGADPVEVARTLLRLRP